MSFCTFDVDFREFLLDRSKLKLHWKHDLRGLARTDLTSKALYDVVTMETKIEIDYFQRNE